MFKYRNMKSSQFSNSSELFHNEYYLNTSFIDSLKHQSLKIQRLMDNMDNMKKQNKKNQSEIIRLKKVQCQLLQQLQAKDRELMTEGANQMIIKELKSQIKELIDEKEELERNAEKMKENCQDKQSQMFQVLLDRQRNSNERIMRQLQKQIRKIKEAYVNCKEENSILRHELETSQKVRKNMEKEISKEKQKISFQTCQWEKKISKLDQSLKKLVKQNQILKQQKNSLEKQLKQQELYFKQQLFQSEERIQVILAELGNLEHKSVQWKNKYTELELLIDKIESMRTEWRTKKGDFWKERTLHEEETINESV